MKQELTQLRQALKLAKTGYHLLEKKRQALLANLHAAKIRLENAQENAAKAVDAAYTALEDAAADVGLVRVQEIRASLYSAAFHNGAAYSLVGTTASLDAAHFAWLRAKEAMLTLADAQNDFAMLAQNIRATQKKAAALGHVTIPNYEARINYIQQELEERERDALARLKRAAARG